MTASINAFAPYEGFMIVREYPGNALSVTVDFDGIRVTTHFKGDTRAQLEQWASYRKAFLRHADYRMICDNSLHTSEPDEIEHYASVMYQRKLVELSAREGDKALTSKSTRE